MRLSFSTLPPHLQLATTKKMIYSSICEFEGSSKRSYICKIMGTNGHLYYDQLDINKMLEIRDVMFSSSETVCVTVDYLLKFRSIFVNKVFISFGTFDSSFCDKDLLELATTIERCNLQSFELKIDSSQCFSTLNLSTIEKIVKNMRKVQHVEIVAEHIELNENSPLLSFEKLTSLKIEGNVDDDVYTHVKTNHLVIIEDRYLSRDTLELCLKAPKVKTLVINYPNYLNDFPDVLNGLEHSVLWDSSFHNKSPLSAIPFLVTGDAHIVSNENNHLLVCLTNRIFFMEQLDGDSEKEIRDDGWKKLRKILEELVANDYELA